MRNTGWYIPYWRKISSGNKKKSKAKGQGNEDAVRSEEQLESVRRRWIERYRRTVHSLATLGLSVGSNRADVQAAYDRVRASGGDVSPEIEDAYRFLMRVLQPPEKRKKKKPAKTAANGSPQVDAAGENGAADAASMADETVEDEEGALSEDDESGEGGLLSAEDGEPGDEDEADEEDADAAASG